ncbi:GNAT family N-acetyltransferase [Actinomadura rudentiformis]|uniref:GNAT family N-acetyltransferase n=1 Tax=Actinomadura rudentiformis TaxID=359158 RepID=UPI00384E8D77
MTEIRIARREDDEALADLDRRTWSPIHAVLPEPPPGKPFFDVAHPPGQHLVAERGGRVVGYVRLVQPVPEPCGDHVRQIQGLAVDTGERCAGVGRALIEAACAEAARQGARRITLRVLGWNTAAQRLYERAGFKIEGVLREEFHLDGQYVDDILMARSLRSRDLPKAMSPEATSI